MNADHIFDESTLHHLDNDGNTAEAIQLLVASRWAMIYSSPIKPSREAVDAYACNSGANQQEV